MDLRVIAGTTLHMMGDPVELRLLGSNYEQHDPTYKRQSTQDRRERDGLLGINARLEGAKINNILAGGVSDALVGKRYYPEDDKSDTNKRCRIDAHRKIGTHRVPSFVLKVERVRLDSVPGLVITALSSIPDVFLDADQIRIGVATRVLLQMHGHDVPGL